MQRTAETHDSDEVFRLNLALMCEPVGDFTDAQLKRGWQVYGKELTAQLRHHDRPGLRPWGFWKFELRRPELNEDENYAAGVVALAEVGELTDREIAKIAKGAEHGLEGVALHQAVTEALEAKKR